MACQMERASRWSHFWQGFWKGLGGVTIPSVFSNTAYSELQEFPSGRRPKSSDFNDCLKAVGDDMCKVLADFDHVLERELKNQAAQTHAEQASEAKTD